MEFSLKKMGTSQKNKATAKVELAEWAGISTSAMMTKFTALIMRLAHKDSYQG